MAVRLTINDHTSQFQKYLDRATARGLQRAGVWYHTACRRAVNKSNPYTRATKSVLNRKTARIQQSKRKGYFSSSQPGEPPRARTGFGRDNIVYEYNGNDFKPAVRVGVRGGGASGFDKRTGRITHGAMYMFYLEVGTRRVAPRPWLVATLVKHKAIIGKLAATP